MPSPRRALLLASRRSSWAGSALAWLVLSAGAWLGAADADSPAANLLVNGSFELGLGAEPFYPGWIAAEHGRIPLPAAVPPLPVIDEEQAHQGRRSLRFRQIPGGKGRAVLAIQAPVLPQAGATRFTAWVKASRPGVVWRFGLCPLAYQGPHPFAPLITGQVQTVWTRMQGEFGAIAGYNVLRAEAHSDSPEPFDLWIDDIVWSAAGVVSGNLRSGPVEGVMIPATRDGMHLAQRTVALTWRADADHDRQVDLTLRIQDMGRGTVEDAVWCGTAILGRQVTEGTIVLSARKRGAYLAELEYRDPATGAILGTARERFTVMSDLDRHPEPVGFAVGSHYGFGFGSERGFSWRGAWSPDELFAMRRKTGFRVMRMIWRWEDLEPVEGTYDWEGSDCGRVIEAAARNGCTTLPCVPSYPLHLTREKYQAALQADDGSKGSWIVRASRDISELGAKSAVMGYAADPAKRKVLLAPPPASLASFLAAFTRRFADRIAGIELMNEANLYITPEALLEHYFKPAYPAIKGIAPALPVVMNQTLDFAADGDGFTGRFFKLGAAQWCDGFTYHPYGKAVIEQDAIEGVRILEKVARAHSPPGRPMVTGMTEIHSIATRAFIRHEAVQRALLDWSMGSRWSAGVIMDGTTLYEGGRRDMYFRPGPNAPGVGALTINALYRVLGGAGLVRRIEVDDHVLMAAFERTLPLPGLPRYVVAVCAGEYPDKTAWLRVDPPSSGMVRFDLFGEALPDDRLPERAIGGEVVYYGSDQPELFERFAASRIEWRRQFEKTVPEVSNELSLASLQSRGRPEMVRRPAGVLTDWQAMRLEDARPLADPLAAGLVDAAGRPTVRFAGAVRTVGGQPFVALGGSAGETGAWLAAATVHAPASGQIEAGLSANVPIRLWINGRLLADEPTAIASPVVGCTWRTLRIPVAAGGNHLVVVLPAAGLPAIFALDFGGVCAGRMGEAPIDSDGFIRRWLLAGPWGNRSKPELTVFPPERQPLALDPALCEIGKNGMPIRWSLVQSPAAMVGHPWSWAVSYAMARIEVDRDQDCMAALGSDDGYALWLNGERIGEVIVSRACVRDDTRIPVRLRRGINTLLFKIIDSGGGGGFMLRFLDPATGRPVIPRHVAPESWR